MVTHATPAPSSISYYPPVRLTRKNLDETVSYLQPISRALARAAFHLGYVVYVYTQANMFRFRVRKEWKHVRHTFTPLNSYLAAQNADNKFITNMLLHEVGVPVSQSVSITREQFFSKKWNVNHLRFPLVVKPVSDTFKGTGVITNIHNKRTVEKHLRYLFRKYRGVLVEEFQAGLHDYRVLVLNDKVIGVLYRIPAFVIGDGVHTVRQLIQAKNRLRRQHPTIHVGPIIIDTQLRGRLRSFRLTLDSVPSANRRIVLKAICNFGAGGEAQDMTDRICPENAELAIRATRAIGLRLAGVDLLCEDIAVPVRTSRGVIIEINQHPDIAMHSYDHPGALPDIARQIIATIAKTSSRV